MNENIVGRCSICNGKVTCPLSWYATIPPVPTCSSCGATEDISVSLPVIKMSPGKPRYEIKNIDIAKKCNCRNGCKSWECDKL